MHGASKALHRDNAVWTRVASMLGFSLIVQAFPDHQMEDCQKRVRWRTASVLLLYATVQTLWAPVVRAYGPQSINMQ